MSWLRRLLHKSESEDRLERELRFHIEQQTAENIAGGTPPDEARRRASMEFGGIERVEEEVRETRWELHVENVARDFHYALRSLRKEWRFAFIAVFALALGIGATTVAFGAFYNLLFNAFSAKDASRLVVVSSQNEERASLPEFSLAPLIAPLPDLERIRAQNHVFEDVAGYAVGFAMLIDGGENRQVNVSTVTTNAFDFYGVSPLLGRGIATSDGVSGAPLVFVMSYKLWTGEFNSDPGILGKSFIVDDKQRTLVAVMPPRFQAFGANAQIWMPAGDNSGSIEIDREPPRFTMMARLKPGVSLPTSSADPDVIVKGLASDRPNDFPKHFSVRVISATDFLLGPYGMGSVGAVEAQHFDVKHVLYDLLAGAMILLLIACTSVANLLLSRATVRDGEIAIRLAMGATRRRLVQQLVVESFALAACASVLGTAFAYAGMKGVMVLVPHQGVIGSEAVIRLDWRILLFVLLVTCLTTVICGLAPAVHAVRRDLQPSLRGCRSGAGASIRHGRLRSAFMVGEVALSILLLAGAGLMMRSFYLLTHMDMGFKLDHVLFVAYLPEHGLKPPSEQDDLNFQKIVQRLKQLPEAVEVASGNSLPGYTAGFRYQVSAPGSSHVERVGVSGSSESLLRALDFQLVRGRWLLQGDVDSSQPVAVINQTMAIDFFGSEDAVGRQFTAQSMTRRSGPPQDSAFQVIGVVRDVKDFGPQAPVVPMAFVPYSVTGGIIPGRILFLKTKGAPASLLRAVQEEIWAVDPHVIFGLQTGAYKDTFYTLTYSPHEFGLMTFAPLAGIALALVVIGVFSVMAYNVSLQTHEIGVRMALGARQGNILRMVIEKGVRLVATGIVIGLFASYALTRYIRSQIWGVSATDRWTFAAVVTIVLVAGLFACLIPAGRAARVDPIVALRYE